MFRSLFRCVRNAAVGALAFGAAASGAQAGSPVEDADFLDALTWGISASSYDELRAKGRERWVEEQLSPPPESRISPALKLRIDALRPVEGLADRLSATRRRIDEIREIADSDERSQAKKANRRGMNAVAARTMESTLLQALYSKDQVRERLVWFWYNYFNVYKGKAVSAASLSEYVDKAIRPNVLGRFHDLLVATVRQPAMLHYLDNFVNRSNRRNENYARELLELHTMGAGSGYSQADVEALSRILTGVGTVWNAPPNQHRLDHSADAIRDDGFVFYPRFHDYGSKVFLGRTIRGQGFKEVEEALRMLSAHPATGRHLSRSLARYFMGGVEPSAALVDLLAKDYAKSDGTIAVVLSTLFHSKEFEGSLDKQFKDPTRFVFSALRLAYDEREIQDAKPVERWLNKLGQGLFSRSTPDGYPLESKAWNSPGQLLARFDVARQIGAGIPDLFAVKPSEAAQTAQAGSAEAPTPSPELKGDLYATILSESLGRATQDALGQATSRVEWNTLFLSSPEFMK